MAEHLCPVWIGYLLASPTRKLFQNPRKILVPYVNEGMTVVYLLASPTRKLFQNPRKILGPYVNEGMTVADIGCAMGFFSLPLARMVGPNGTVICVDVQEKMIRSLEKRAQKAGLSGRIQKIDFALAFAVVHEVSDAAGFFSEIHKAMKPAGRLFVAEPKGHVSEKDFEITVSIAKQSGFTVADRPQIKRSRTVLLQKKS